MHSVKRVPAAIFWCDIFNKYPKLSNDLYEFYYCLQQDNCVNLAFLDILEQKLNLETDLSLYQLGEFNYQILNQILLRTLQSKKQLNYSY